MRHLPLLFIIFWHVSGATPPCDSTRLPIVFVHGFLGSGDTWAGQIKRFLSSEYCDEKLFVFDWNSTGGRAKTDSLLGNFIDDVLKRTAAPKVNLIGHSAGGGLCYGYLKDSARASKVAHYVHIGSGSLKKPAGDVPTLVIQSKGDMVLGITKESPESENLLLEDKDHLEVATCMETFRAMYSFFNPDKAILPSAGNKASEKVRLGGKAVTLGENKPLPFQAVSIFYLDSVSGKRKNKMPDHILVTDENGRLPVCYVLANSYVEIQIKPQKGRTVSYFFEPFREDNMFFYLRCLPETGLAAMMLNKVPKDDKQCAMAFYCLNRAVIAGRDSLAIDSIALSTPELMPAERTSIAAFLFDDGDGKSGKTALKNFGAGVFMNGIDILLPASPDQFAVWHYNGRRIAVPRRPSSECIQIAVFD